MNIIKLEFPLQVSDLDKGEIFYLKGYYISFQGRFIYYLYNAGVTLCRDERQ